MTDTLNTRSQLDVNGKSYDYFSIKKAADALGADFSKLPYSMKVILENLLRFEDGKTVSVDDIKAIASWAKNQTADREIAYRPARVLMQDFTGVPAVVDLAAMRDAVKNLGGDPQKINPLSPVDLVIDHSLMVDHAGDESAFEKNVALEMKRNNERYEFLKWGQSAFNNFRAVPPGTGICHQVNLEYLSKVVWTKDENGTVTAYPDTLVGTDSHTTMVNGLAVLGWGVGGIEAESAMLGQPISMLLPEVIGFKITGTLKEGTTATDLVLTITQMLREKGVVGKFVEFYGEGLSHLPLSDRATIANMSPEYGATCGFFPIDIETIKYLELSARPAETILLVEAYAKEQGMWRDSSNEPEFTDSLELDISTVEPAIAGPKRPQDKINLSDSQSEYKKLATELSLDNNALEKEFNLSDKDYNFKHGNIVIAAITSCTNTSNPNVMIAAGLVAKKAASLGLKVKPWVKTSLAPGSQVVTEYLEKANLQDDLDKLGFNTVGYGCTTCIGNSGPLDPIIDSSIRENNILVTSVLSGNRNFEGRVHPLTKGNYLMSPPLVVAYALAGTMDIDLVNDVISQDSNGNDIYLKDIWPSNSEVSETVSTCVTSTQFKEKYSDVFSGTKQWQDIEITGGETFNWNSNSTYIQNPPYFEGMNKQAGGFSDVKSAKILGLFGDSITTDHISPAGVIAKDSPAAKYLADNGVDSKDFNSYGSRRGNHQVMMRGTFANVRIKNEMADGKEGGYTKSPNGEIVPIYDAAMEYKNAGTPLVVFGGNDYGMGSSRDWAAKGTILLGVKAVIVESFERIHRSNLVGMGVLPLTFKNGQTWKTLNLDGTETVDISGIEGGITPKMDVQCTITRKNGVRENIVLLCRIDTADEVEYYRNGGILHKVLRDLVA